MLGPFYKFQLTNSLGQTITPTIKWVPWYFSSSGVLTFGAAITDGTYSGTNTITNGTTADGSSNTNNTGTPYLGAFGTVAMTWTGTPAGAVTLKILRSLDGTNWPADAEAQFVYQCASLSTGTSYTFPFVISGG
jgi:hypothetical protein